MRFMDKFLSLIQNRAIRGKIEKKPSDAPGGSFYAILFSQRKGRRPTYPLGHHHIVFW
jgi:hypothetical protein